PSDRALASLTDRERQVMALVAEGLSNDEIAARLFLSPLTSKTHVSRIMSKLNARDRAQLVVLAYETGLVTPGHRDPRGPGPRYGDMSRCTQICRSEQHELTVVVGIGVRLTWRVTSDSAGRRLAGLGPRARRHHRERDRDGCADENRQSHEYAAEELHVDH